jgi:hypothetical protein
MCPWQCWPPPTPLLTERALQELANSLCSTQTFTLSRVRACGCGREHAGSVEIDSDIDMHAGRALCCGILGSLSIGYDPAHRWQKPEPASGSRAQPEAHAAALPCRPPHGTQPLLLPSRCHARPTTTTAPSSNAKPAHPQHCPHASCATMGGP